MTECWELLKSYLVCDYYIKAMLVGFELRK